MFSVSSSCNRAYHVHDIVAAAGHVVVMSPNRPVGGPFVQSPSLALEQHGFFFVRVRLFTTDEDLVGLFCLVWWSRRTRRRVKIRTCALGNENVQSQSSIFGE